MHLIFSLEKPLLRLFLGLLFECPQAFLNIVVFAILSLLNSRFGVVGDPFALAVPLSLRPGKVVPGIIDRITKLRLGLFGGELLILLVLCLQLVDRLLSVQVFSVQF